MNKTQLFCIALLASFFPNIFGYFAADKAVWYGTVKFPSSMKITEPISVYYAGEQIAAEIEQEMHQVSFAISEYKMRNIFCLLISNNLEWASEQNTIKYQRVREGKPYKLYLLEFKPNKELLKTKQNVDILARGHWEITEKRLDTDRRIPDNAILVHYHPHLVETVKGGTALELPKIVLNEQVLDQFTQDELADASAQFILSSLDTKTIHAKQNTQIKSDFTNKTIIALTA